MKNKLFVLMPAIFLSVTLISCTGNNNKTELPKKIEVTGSAEMEVVPDEIYMTFTLKEYLDAAKKKVKLESIKTNFLALCKAAGVVDSNISISGYTGNERWDYYYYKRRKTQPDFMGSISYVVKVSAPDKLNKLVASLNENAVENFCISKTSNSNIEQLRKDVKTKALLAGKTKADYLAKSIGEELGEALLIQEIDNSYNSYYSNSSAFSNTLMESKMESNADKSLTPGFEKIKLRYEMKIEFKLK